MQIMDKRFILSVPLKNAKQEIYSIFSCHSVIYICEKGATHVNR